MNSNRILTRKLFGLDYRVWRAMIVIFVLSAGLLSYTLMDHPAKCIPVDIKIKAISENDSVYFTNDILSFRIQGSDKNATWDFDDKSEKVEGTFVTHRFANAGKYLIKVKDLTGCDYVKPVTIKKAVVEETDKSIKKINGNDKTFVRTPETFSFSKTAESYEWKISNHPEMGNRNGATATYKFEQSGEYTIELTLDKNRLKKYTKVIKVAGIPKLIDDKPVPGTTKGGGPGPSKIVISESTFQEFLGKVVSGVYFAGDFDKYLCAEGATPVILNGKKNKPTTFTEVCDILNGKRVKKNFTGIGRRAIKIKSVKLIRDPKSICVTSIEINYD